MKSHYCSLILSAIIIVSGCSSSTETVDETKTQETAGEKTADKVENAEPKIEKKPAISLEVADLEKLDSWDATGTARATLTEILAEVMKSITDKASADASIEKFRELASKFAAVDRASKTLGEISGKDRKAYLKILGPANVKFNEAYTTLKTKEQLFESVQDALDKAYIGEEF